MKVTCTQEWHPYNEAQTHEQERFVELLRDLCNGIPQPEYRFGRPRLPLGDVVFSAAFKVYSTVSTRRFMTDLREAQVRELVAKAPSCTSNYRSLENPELTPILKSLIEQSAAPLRTIETDFAVDSSGFSTSVYDRWFDHKYGRERSQARWLKTHLICGVFTHIVTSAEVTAPEVADAPLLPELVNKTAENFSIREVSADKGYSSKGNLEAIQGVGAMPYVPFKTYSKGNQGHHAYSGLWNQMWHFYNFNRECFLVHYHKRSNVESVFSMIKAKFGTHVRAKTPTAHRLTKFCARCFATTSAC